MKLSFYFCYFLFVLKNFITYYIFWKRMKNVLEGNQYLIRKQDNVIDFVNILMFIHMIHWTLILLSCLLYIFDAISIDSLHLFTRNSFKQVLSLLLEFFTSALADGFSLESEWQQVSSSLQDSSQDSGCSQ